MVKLVETNDSSFMWATSRDNKQLVLCDVGELICIGTGFIETIDGSILTDQFNGRDVAQFCHKAGFVQVSYELWANPAYIKAVDLTRGKIKIAVKDRIGEYDCTNNNIINDIEQLLD